MKVGDRLKYPPLIRVALHRLNNHHIELKYLSLRSNMIKTLKHIFQHLDVGSGMFVYKGRRKSYFHPSFKQIANKLGFNFWTMRHIMRKLKELGLIYCVSSKPLYVHPAGDTESKKWIRDAFRCYITPDCLERLNIDPELLERHKAWRSLTTKTIKVRSRVNFMLKSKAYHLISGAKKLFSCPQQADPAVQAPCSSHRSSAPKQASPSMPGAQQFKDRIIESAANGEISGVKDYLIDMVQSHPERKTLILDAFPSLSRFMSEK